MRPCARVHGSMRPCAGRLQVGAVPLINPRENAWSSLFLVPSLSVCCTLAVMRNAEKSVPRHAGGVLKTPCTACARMVHTSMPPCQQAHRHFPPADTYVLKPPLLPRAAPSALPCSDASALAGARQSDSGLANLLALPRAPSGACTHAASPRAGALLCMHLVEPRAPGLHGHGHPGDEVTSVWDPSPEACMRPEGCDDGRGGDGVRAAPGAEASPTQIPACLLAPRPPGAGFAGAEEGAPGARPAPPPMPDGAGRLPLGLRRASAVADPLSSAVSASGGGLQLPPEFDHAMLLSAVQPMDARRGAGLPSRGSASTSVRFSTEMAAVPGSRSAGADGGGGGGDGGRGDSLQSVRQKSLGFQDLGQSGLTDDGQQLSRASSVAGALRRRPSVVDLFALGDFQASAAAAPFAAKPSTRALSLPRMFDVLKRMNSEC
eukprot:361987-Chlamydomonas_euryale.AAC.3